MFGDDLAIVVSFTDVQYARFPKEVSVLKP